MRGPRPARSSSPRRDHAVGTGREMTATAFGALLIILAGALARRVGLLSRDDGPALVRIVVYLALPPLIFLILVRAELHTALLLVPVAAYLIHGILVAFAYGSARVARLDRPRTGALIVAIAVGNTGFFGIPLIVASGDGFSLPAAVMYDALATGVITWTSTVIISSAFGVEGHARVSWRDVVRLLWLPPNIALAAGIAVNLMGVSELPAAIERPLELASAAVLPLVMIYAGLLVDFRGLGAIWREVGYITVARLGLAALVGLAVAVALGIEGDALNTVVIMAGMPVAMMSLVIGSSRGLPSDMLAGAVVVTTLLATITLPIIRSLVL